MHGWKQTKAYINLVKSRPLRFEENVCILAPHYSIETPESRTCTSNFRNTAKNCKGNSATDSLMFFFMGSISAVAPHPPRCVLQWLWRNLSDLYISYGTTFEHEYRHTLVRTSSRVNEQQNLISTHLLLWQEPPATFQPKANLSFLLLNFSPFKSSSSTSFKRYPRPLPLSLNLSRSGSTQWEKKIFDRLLFTSQDVSAYIIYVPSCIWSNTILFHSDGLRRRSDKKDTYFLMYTLGFSTKNLYGYWPPGNQTDLAICQSNFFFCK